MEDEGFTWYDDDRLIFVIAYLAVGFSSGLVGLLCGWFMWG